MTLDAVQQTRPQRIGLCGSNEAANALQLGLSHTGGENGAKQEAGSRCNAEGENRNLIKIPLKEGYLMMRERGKNDKG